MTTSSGGDAGSVPSAAADLASADLASGDPVRVRSALAGLVAAHRAGLGVRVPFPGVDVLDVFGREPDEAALLAFLELLRCGAFEPSLGWQPSIDAQVDALVRFGGGRSALDVALELLTHAFDPVSATREAMWHLWSRGLQGPDETTAAARLVSYLLDGSPEVRAAVLDALRPWPDVPEFAAVVREVLPELSTPERAALLDDEQEA